MAGRRTSGRPGPAPALDHGDAVPTAALTVAAVARRLGVAPATLRTWDRRYGIGPSEHTTGSRRRYLPADVARLDEMRRLTRAGVTAAEAAEVALAAGPSQQPERPERPVRRRRGGGRALALPEADARVHGLATAALALDARAVAAGVRSALAAHGVVRTWDELLVPVLTGIGVRWEATGQGVDVEHLLSECVIGALTARTARSAPPARSRPVLLASAPEEMHALPLFALAAALADHGVPSRLLGARVPADALAAAYRRLGPPALFVWAQSAQTGDPGPLTELPQLRPRAAVLVGGPGWPPEPPTPLTRVWTLTDARDRLLAAVA